MAAARPVTPGRKQTPAYMRQDEKPEQPSRSSRPDVFHAFDGFPATYSKDDFHSMPKCPKSKNLWYFFMQTFSCNAEVAHRNNAFAIDHDIPCHGTLLSSRTYYRIFRNEHVFINTIPAISACRAGRVPASPGSPFPGTDFVWKNCYSPPCRDAGPTGARLAPGADRRRTP